MTENDWPWLEKFIERRLPVIIYTTKGTWYAGPILSRTTTTLRMEVTAYVRTNHPNPIKDFEVSEIQHMEAAEYLCEICGGPINGPHTEEECFK